MTSPLVPSPPWQLQEAKQRLSELVERALTEGPQVVTRRGTEVCVVLSMREYAALLKPRESFKSFLQAAPDFEALELDRSQALAPAFELVDA